jgi:2-oxoglutarate dehydrogenase E1 component
MKDFSFVTNSHPGFVEELYKDFVNNSANVDPELKKFFEGFDFAVSQQAKTQTTANALDNTTSASSPVSQIATPANLDKEFAVYQLIRAYRKRGHLISDTNPIKKRKDRHAN